MSFNVLSLNPFSFISFSYPLPIYWPFLLPFLIVSPSCTKCGMMVMKQKKRREKTPPSPSLSLSLNPLSLFLYPFPFFFGSDPHEVKPRASKCKGLATRISFMSLNLLISLNWPLPQTEFHSHFVHSYEWFVGLWPVRNLYFSFTKIDRPEYQMNEVKSGRHQSYVK